MKPFDKPSRVAVPTNGTIVELEAQKSKKEMYLIEIDQGRMVPAVREIIVEVETL